MISQLNSRKKQQILMIICCLVYTFAYTGRYGYNSNIAPIMEAYGITRADAGLVSTFFFFAYGATQLVHGILCKYYPKRFIIPLALVLSAVCNLIVFLEPPFAIIKFLWLVNGVCQSTLWPTMVLVLGETLERDLMKQAVFVMSLSTMFGTLISYGGSALFNLIPFYRASFLMGAVLMACIGSIWFFSYNTLTENKYHPQVAETAEIKATKPKRRLESSLVWLLAVCILLAISYNFVKDGLTTWTPVILKERFGLDDSISIILTLVLPICGMFGAALSIAVNKFIPDYCQLSAVFYAVMSLCIGGLFFLLDGKSCIPALILLGVISALAHGLNNIMTSLMPLTMRDKINSGFLAGLMNGASYVGSTVSSYGLGSIADKTDWNTVIMTLLATSVVSTGIAVIAVIVNLIRKMKKKNCI